MLRHEFCSKGAKKLGHVVSAARGCWVGAWALGVRVRGLELRVWGLGFRV